MNKFQIVEQSETCASSFKEDSKNSPANANQTTQQVTTVTQVPRDIKQMGHDVQQVNFVSIPVNSEAEVKHSDYVRLPVGIYTRPQYINYNHMDQKPLNLMDSTAAVVTEAQYQPHYQELKKYQIGLEQYKKSEFKMHPGKTLIDYNHVDQSGTSLSPSENSNSTSPLSMNFNSLVQPGFLMSPDFIKGKYDEIPDNRVTASSGVPGDHCYPEESSAVLYGYVTTPQYTTKNVQHNSNRSFNPTYEFESEQELQKHMSNLQLHSHSMFQQSKLSSSNIHNACIIENQDNHIDINDHRQMRWRDPNLTEVICFLDNPNNTIKANAAAYLQHLCYMDDPNKQRTRTLGGIPPLVRLLSHENSDVFRNACGALRNLSYGRQNDENKRAIKNESGIPSLINLLRRTLDSDIKELVTGVIWNMSSCEDLKRPIIEDGVVVIVSYVIIPNSGWHRDNSGETCWSTVFRNASGVLRNVSSAGEYARTKLRDCDGLVDALLYVVRNAIDKSNIGNKIVENCVCVLRNLSYRCQEVEDTNYDLNPMPQQNVVLKSQENKVDTDVNAGSASKMDNLGCFGAIKKKKEQNQLKILQHLQDNDDNISNGKIIAAKIKLQRQEPRKGSELLWQPDVVPSYLVLLQSCSNPETLEAAAGALQNLAACYWQPSIEIRAAVRKEKGLPILVELLRMEVDRVVCAVATALRNLAIDQRNKELIGKYAMRDLVHKLPSGNPQHDQGTSDDTIAAVLATLNEVIKKNLEFSRSFLDAGGVERLLSITRQRHKYTPRVLKFASQVLFSMWQQQEQREVYKKNGWKEQDFVPKIISTRYQNASILQNQLNAPSSPNNANNTLNRPMASQSGTRYEDRTIKRQQSISSSGQVFSNEGVVGAMPVYQRADQLTISEIVYHENHQPNPINTVRLYSSNGKAQNNTPSASN